MKPPLLLRDDPAYEAALADARRTDCCGNDSWRGHFCQYHQGYEDGYDAALVQRARRRPRLQ